MKPNEIEEAIAQMAEIAKELHEQEWVGEDLSEMLLEFWREFNFLTDRTTFGSG